MGQGVEEGLARLLKLAGHSHTHNTTANHWSKDREEGCEMAWLGLCWVGHRGDRGAE